nr:MAG TPA: hypothetical protein [Caudoviricetes sp.]
MFVLIIIIIRDIIILIRIIVCVLIIRNQHIIHQIII